MNCSNIQWFALCVHLVLCYSPFYLSKQLPQLLLSASPLQLFGIARHLQSQNASSQSQYLHRLKGHFFQSVFGYHGYPAPRLCIIVIADFESTVPHTKKVNTMIIKSRQSVCTPQFHCNNYTQLNLMHEVSFLYIALLFHSLSNALEPTCEKHTETEYYTVISESRFEKSTRMPLYQCWVISTYVACMCIKSACLTIDVIT